MRLGQKVRRIQFNKETCLSSLNVVFRVLPGGETRSKFSIPSEVVATARDPLEDSDRGDNSENK